MDLSARILLAESELVCENFACEESRFVCENFACGKRICPREPCLRKVNLSARTLLAESGCLREFCLRKANLSVRPLLAESALLGKVDLSARTLLAESELVFENFACGK